MPRKHPRDDEKTHRPSFAVQQERREARAERRRRKSSDSGLAGGILTNKEIETLEADLEALKNKPNRSDEDNAQMANLRRELALDKKLKN